MNLYVDIQNKRGWFFIVFLLCNIIFVLWEQSPCHAKTAQLNDHAKHISSYQKLDAAIQDLNLLKAKGFKSYVKRVHIPGKGTWYRVYIVKSQLPSSSRNAVESQKRVSVKVSPAGSSFRSASKKNQCAISKPNPEIQVKGVKDFHGHLRMTMKKSAISDVHNGKSDRSSVPNTGKGSGQIKDTKVIFQISYESARNEFDAGHYEKAAGLLSSILSKKQNDAALHENSFRCLADCFYFLAGGGDRNFNSKAIDAYKNILRYYPDLRSGNDLVNFRLANCLERIGSYEEAYTAYENIARQYPSSRYEQDALYKMGEILYQTKHFTHAAEKLKNYLIRYPDGSHASLSSFLIAYCYRQTSQQTEGAIWYRQALNKENDFEKLPADVLHDLGIYLFSLQDYSHAATVFTSYLNLYPEGVLRKSVLFHLGRSFYSLNRFPSALKIFSLLLESYPETGEAYESILFMANIGVMNPTINFNVCLAGRDYFRSPVETYDWMREKYPGGPLEEWLLYQKGYALWKAGRCKEAFDLYCHLLDTFSHGILQKESRGYLLLNAKRLIEESYGRGDNLTVADIYYKVRGKILLSPETCDLFFKAGISLRKLGLMSDATLIWNCLKKNGQSASNRTILDLIAMEADCSREGTEIPAEKWNVLLTGLKKSNGEIADMTRKNIADYFHRKGQYDKVISLYETLLKGKGNSGLLTTQGNYAHSLKSRNLCSTAMTQYQEIISKCKDPLQCEEGLIAEAYAGLGDCYFEAGDYQRDIAMYQQALPKTRDKKRQMWALFRMGQSYKKTNDTAMAAKIFSELKEKGDTAFWPKVVDCWDADQVWSRNNSEYLKKKLKTPQFNHG